MINSASSSDRPARPDALAVANANRRPAGPAADQFSAAQAERLRAALAAQPAVRPAVVQRGRELAADPAYPPAAVLRHIAALVLHAPDPADE